MFWNFISTPQILIRTQPTPAEWYLMITSDTPGGTTVVPGDVLVPIIGTRYYFSINEPKIVNLTYMSPFKRGAVFGSELGVNPRPK